MDQALIKIVLILVFLGFGIVLLRPSLSAKNQAFRSLVILLFLFAAIVAIIFPEITNELAVLAGVGRGADLVLYAFIVVFIGHALNSARRRRLQNDQITELARNIALSNPIFPNEIRK